VLCTFDVPTDTGPPEKVSDENNAGNNDDNSSGKPKRTSLLKVIRALAEMNDTLRRGGILGVEHKLEAMGFDGPTDDTIRKIFKEAQAIEPDRKPKSES
jgi:hypothetical protein